MREKPLRTFAVRSRYLSISCVCVCVYIFARLVVLRVRFANMMKDKDSSFLLFCALSPFSISCRLLLFGRVSEEDKSNNKKNPASSLTREEIYLSAHTYQHGLQQVFTRACRTTAATTTREAHPRDLSLCSADFINALPHPRHGKASCRRRRRAVIESPIDHSRHQAHAWKRSSVSVSVRHLPSARSSTHLPSDN